MRGGCRWKADSLTHIQSSTLNKSLPWNIFGLFDNILFVCNTLGKCTLDFDLKIPFEVDLDMIVAKENVSLTIAM